MSHWKTTIPRTIEIDCETPVPSGVYRPQRFTDAVLSELWQDASVFQRSRADTTELLDLLTDQEIARILARWPDWRLPRGVGAAERMRRARELNRIHE